MANQLTEKQINWAKSHDWFVGKLGDCIEVADRYSQQHKDGTITHHNERIVWTKSFAELRNWAGY